MGNVGGWPNVNPPVLPNGPTGADGPTGVQGETGFGIQGETGLDGINGETGLAGINGETGPQGETGLDGLSIVGETGVQGETGLDGIQGETGLQGPVGDSGPQGDTGLRGIQGATGIKAAILKLDGEYRALICTEAPEARFEDIIEGRIWTGTPCQYFNIDPLFIQSCEPDTIKLISAHSDDVGLGHSRSYVSGSQIIFEPDEKLSSPGCNISIRFKVTGIRIGFLDRFKIMTEAQAKKNDDFWSRSIN